MHRFALANCLVLLSLATAAEAQEAEPTERPVDQGVIKRFATQIEPDLQGSQARIRQYVDSFRLGMANDARLCAFAVAGEPVGKNGVRLTGFVEFPETRNALEAYFKTLGFSPVENQVATMPSEQLGAKRFGIIKSPHSLSYAEPAEKEVVTDCLLGESLFLMQLEDDHYLVHGGDGSLGYVAATDILPVDEAAMR
jgi:gamma-D-glutamyl-L-lysine dipeptidyl-peptidase